MKRLVYILVLVLVSFGLKAQTQPSGIPSPRSDSGFAQYNWIRLTKGGMIYPSRDTLFTPTYIGTTIYWANPVGDSSLWIYQKTTGRKWAKVVTVNSSTSPGTGTVTSIATNDGTGITGGTITSTGTLVIDTSSIISTKANVTALVNQKLNISDTAAMLSNRLKISDTVTMLSVYAKTGNVVPNTRTINTNAPLAGGGALSSDLTLVADTGRANAQLVSGGSLNKVRDSLQANITASVAGVSSVSTTNNYGISSSVATPTTTPNISIGVDTSLIIPYTDTLKINGIATKTDVRNSVTGGTVTSIATTNGILGGTITTTGTIQVDSSLYSTKGYVLKIASDTSTSLRTLINTKGTGNGTVTSVAAGTGMSFTTITSTGSVNADTSVLSTKAYVLKVASDTSTSLRTLINTKGTGNGTVTSVALSLPSFITVSGSPITTSGTLTGTLANQTANKVFASATSGSPAQPTFRALVAADLPDSYLPISDTSAMLSHYAYKDLTNTPFYDTTTALRASINTKLNISDTAGKWIANQYGQTLGQQRAKIWLSDTIKSSFNVVDSNAIVGVNSLIFSVKPSFLITTPNKYTAPVFVREVDSPSVGLSRGLNLLYKPTNGSVINGNGLGLIYSIINSNGDMKTMSSIESPAIEVTPGLEEGQLQMWFQHKGIEHQPAINFRMNESGGIWRGQILSVDNEGSITDSGAVKALGLGSVSRGEILTLDTTGFNGIDTLHPKYKWHVNGNGKYEDTLFAPVLNVGQITYPSTVVINGIANTALAITGAGTSRSNVSITNTGGSLDFGVGSSSANSLFTGQAAYDAAFGTGNATGVSFATNNLVRYTINSSGNHDFKNGNILTTGSITGGSIIKSGATSSQALIGDGSVLTVASTNTASAIVQRDGSGNFAANNISLNHLIGTSGALSSTGLGTNVSSITISGTDLSMSVTVTTSGAVSGTVGTINFNNAFGVTPRVVISCANTTTAAATSQLAANGTGTGTYIIAANISGAGTYVYNVIVAE